MTYRAKLQATFLTLGLAAIALTGWLASADANAALEQATYDRLTAIRQTRVRQIERWFQDLGSHTLALATDESTISALEAFAGAWPRLEPLTDRQHEQALRAHYDAVFGPASAQAEAWFPRDPRSRALQWQFIANNPHPLHHKDRLLSAPGVLGAIHARFHPTFHRYHSAFGFYDIFLIDAAEARVLYSVFKEVDLGIHLRQPPYRDSALAQAFERALALPEPERYVTLDYSPYFPSQQKPAAFLAAPVWRAGQQSGVLVIQVSLDEVNRVMLGDGSEEGLGASGEVYIIGSDGLLRSDLRRAARRNTTAVLTLAATPEAVALHRASPGTHAGHDARGVPVLRSHARLNIPGLDWSLMAEIEEAEAFAPERRLRLRILGIGTLIALVFLAVAAALARSVTRPLQELAEAAARFGRRQFGDRLEATSRDELGDLARSFNSMADELERTTVSKEELQALAGQLITAQEDERRRIARELHDDLTQRMAVVAIEAGRLNDPAAARIRDHMAQLSREIHGLSRRLHPALLDDLGLVAAVENEGRALFERGGPLVELSAEGDGRDLPQPIELALFRIVQEGLRNVEKHAQASTVRIVLDRVAGDAHLILEDDGRGFDRNAPGWHAGIGLASIQERARLLAGVVQINSRPDAGTRIEVKIPLAQTNHTAG